MSLVNKVLHDLEERHAFLAMQSQSVLSDLRSAQDYAHGARAAGNRTAAVLGALVLCAAIAFLMGRDWLAGPAGAPAPELPARAVQTESPATRTAPPVAKQPTAVPAPANEAPAADSGLQLKLDMPVPAIVAAPEVEQDVIAEPPVVEQYPAPIAGGAPMLLKVSLEGDVSGVRIVLLFSQPPRYNLHLLDHPDRLLVLVPGTDLPLAPLREYAPFGVVLGLRHGRQAGDEKLVFDLAAPVVIEDSQVRARPDGHAVEIRLASSAPAQPVDAMELTDESMAPLIEPGDYESTIQPALQVVRRPPEVESPADREFRLGAEAYRLGDLTQAIDRFHRAIRKEPSHLKARQFLVAVLIDQGDLDGANRYAVEGLGHHPGDPVLVRSSARILFEKGRADDALRVLSNSNPALEDDPDHYALMAAILQQQGRHADAVELYGRLVSLDPERGVWWAGLGISLESVGRAADAITAYERARRDSAAPADVRRYASDRIVALSRRSG